VEENIPGKGKRINESGLTSQRGGEGGEAKERLAGRHKKREAGITLNQEARQQGEKKKKS
jgi:hypothetical protein